MKTKNSKKFKNRTFKKDDSTGLGIKPENLRVVTMVLNAVNHPLRLKILDRLQEWGPSTSSEMSQFLRKEESVATQQLTILTKAGLVSFSEGDENYTINLVEVEKIKELTEEVS